MKKNILKNIKNVLGENRYMVIRRSFIVGSKKVYRITFKVRKLFKKPVNQSSAAAKNTNFYVHKKHISEPLELECQEDVNGISIITLNLNGESFLKTYLDGLLFLMNRPIQLIFVDHGSTDNSVELVRKFCSDNLIDIELIELDFNDTYSASNNRALTFVKYDYVLFLNNDLALTHETRVHLALDALQDLNVGVVGWNLYHDFGYSDSQHHGVGFYWDAEFGFFRPYNISTYPESSGYGMAYEYLAVTAAVALMRKKDLLSIGGFNNNYNYGYEDVDLGMRLNASLNKKSIVINGCLAVHRESTTQKSQSRLKVASRRQKNINYFKSQYGYHLRRLHRESVFLSERPTRQTNIQIGFVVTECHEGAIAGDFFTALELSISLRKKTACDIRFLPQRGPDLKDQFNAEGLDLVIVLIDRFNISELQNCSPHLIKIAWMRNWFDRWPTWGWFHDYEFYWTSSEKSLSYVYDVLNKPSMLVRIATNKDRFYCPPDQWFRDIDICFAGSYWNVPREIEQCYEVLARFNTHFYGHGWDKHEQISSMHKGILDYHLLPNVYARTKIIVDDGAVSTKQWASINSRVFDAAAAGCLVITNAIESVSELSDECLIPTYNSPQELSGLLEFYLNDKDARLAKVKEVSDAILSEHTYDFRSEQICKMLPALVKNKLRFAIKVPAPNQSVKHQWGDYHFGISLKKSIENLGHSARVDLLCDWDSDEALGDDVNIVLRGLSAFTPKADQINIMWNISHPDKIASEEYLSYDLVFVASKIAAKNLANQIRGVEIRPLLQCTDTSRFYNDIDISIAEHPLLFVGNSRNVYREVVRYSIEEKLPISVYGGLWAQFVNKQFIKGENIPNDELRKYYSSASVVLNDHWDTMRENGFTSNRLFDAVASGAVVVSDRVAGLDDEFFGNSVVFYQDKISFIEAVNEATNRTADIAAVKRIRNNESFDARAKTIIAAALDLHTEKIQNFS